MFSKKILKMYDSQSRFITHVQAVILFIPNSVNRSRRSSHMFTCTIKYTTYKVLNTEKLFLPPLLLSCTDYLPYDSSAQSFSKFPEPDGAIF